MDDLRGSSTFFVSRYHEHPPATLERLLRVPSTPDSTSLHVETNTADMIRELRAVDDEESDSDYQCSEEASDDDIYSSELELDEWRLHATEPREGLYLQEMRRQRGRMDEKEVQWVRGYIKAQRAWKAQTGRCIDEFQTTNNSDGGMKKSRSVKADRSFKPFSRVQDGQQQEQETPLIGGFSCLETVMLIASVVFVCLSLVVQGQMKPND